MFLQESEKLVINQLINYAKLPLEKKNIVENGEFLFTIKKRRGCPISESELSQRMNDAYSRACRNNRIKPPVSTLKRRKHR